MITDPTKWEEIDKIGEYTIKKQFIGSKHQRWLYAIFTWGTFRKYVDSPPEETEQRFYEVCCFWELERCINWINRK